MTSAGFVIRMAWREARAARSRLLLLTASVMAGVGALVAVNSFTDNLTVSIAEQAQALLGADLVLSGRQPLADIKPAQRLIDSLRTIGGATVRLATSANFIAMAYRPHEGGARAVQVRSVDPQWPFHGAIATSPVGIWSRLQNGGIIVDPSLLSALDVHVGDSLALGDARFMILGTVVNVPGDIGLEMALGPRVFMATRDLASTGLLTFGSRVQYQTYVALPVTVDPELVERDYQASLRLSDVTLRTAADDRDTLTHRLADLGHFLSLVALAALLLGGLGVASAVHVFIRRQLDSIAVLRTLGATSVQVFAIYLMLAVAMGLLGSLLGALAGVGLQQAMPLVLHAFIPANVRIVPSLRAIASGAALGVWTAAVFALLPLAGIRAVSPLATLRRNTDPPRMRWDALRIAAVAALIVSVVALAAVAAGSLERGAWFAGAIGGTIAVLWLASLALMAAARRWIPVTLPYLFRQGLANLHRPANQTLTVVLALGFGTFLLGTVFSVQRNLLEVVQVDRPGRSRANLVLFDVQTGQRALVDSVLRAESVAADSFTPMVPMRIRELKGQAVSTLESSSDTLTADAETDRNSGASGAGPSLWALRREYRSTWRATLNPADHLVAGRWFVPSTAASGRTAADPAPISMESGLAAELGVTVGDAITWDVQGVPVYSRVMSLRDVDWARFELNFFVVFAPGALESAPQTWATMAHAPNDTVRGRVQREVAERAANVTAIDLAEVQAALETVISHIATAIRFMALFSLFTGAVVLVGAIATSRWQRVREGTLLRTLGATRAQVLIILIVEYIALGFAAAFVASLLAVAAGWSLAHWEFKTPFVAPWLQLGLLALVLVALTVTAGLWGSVEVLKRPPLEVLRND